MDKAPHVDLTLVMTRSFLSQQDDKAIQPIANQTHTVHGLSTPIHALASKVIGPDKFKFYFREMYHIWRSYKHVKSTKPDLIYTDRSNILIAAIFARFTNIPVVLRLLGIPPSLQSILSGRKPFERLMKWAFRSPFAYVICSQDGSSSEKWMQQALATNIPRVTLLNGVAKPHTLSITHHKEKTLPSRTRPITLTFLGRLETIKKADFFIDAILQLDKKFQNHIAINVIGDGSLKADLEKRIKKSNAQSYTHFTGAIPHEQVHDILSKTDIYISLNQQGHLSNANLEAICHGCCFVIQKTDPKFANDNTFFQLIPEDAVITIEHMAKPSDLSDALNQLIGDQEKLQNLQNRMNTLSQSKLKTWDDRISQELKLLKNIALQI